MSCNLDIGHALVDFFALAGEELKWCPCFAVICRLVNRHRVSNAATKLQRHVGELELLAQRQGQSYIVWIVGWGLGDPASSIAWGAQVCEKRGWMCRTPVRCITNVTLLSNDSPSTFFYQTESEKLCNLCVIKFRWISCLLLFWSFLVEWGFEKML